MAIDESTAPARVAMVQINSCVGDLAGNSDLIFDWVTRAANGGADLILLPELALCGSPLADLTFDTAFVAANEAAVEALAKRLADADLADKAVVVGHVAATPNGTTNRASVLRNGVVEATYDKQVLATDGRGESRSFTPGDAPLTITVGTAQVAITIGDDAVVNAPDRPDIVAVLDAAPFTQSQLAARQEQLTHLAQATGATVAYVNAVGGQDHVVFAGGSQAIAGDGTQLARAPQFAEHFTVFSPGERAEISPALEPLAQLYRALVLGIADYVRKNGFTSVALGLSGGIDSALVAALSVDALGGPQVTAISMPSKYSTQHSRDDAADLARRVGLDYRVVPIGDVVAAFEETLPFEGVAEENVQARTRAVLLMAVANSEGKLVLAPGNKSELTVGYATIYGDAVGGYAPLKDVTKTQVWALARWRNNFAIDNGAVPPIPESIISKPPSAELRPGQLDQDSLPDYAVLDPIVEAIVERRATRDDLIAAGHDEAAVDQVRHLMAISEWKRQQFAPGPQVTSRSFGPDRRLPITNRWQQQ